MEEIIERLVSVEGRTAELERWQEKQNGTLQRLEGKIDGINKWLIGLMGGVIASLFLLVTQILAGR